MILIVDISRYDDDLTTPQMVDFVKMKAAGAVGVIFKASQGKNADPVFASSWKAAKLAGLLRGAYHYLDTAKTAVEQANFFCDTLSTDPGEMPPFVDVEQRQAYNGVPTITLAFLNDFRRQMLARGYLRFGTYLSPSYANEIGLRNDISWADSYLWIANYYTTQPAIPLPWKTWHIWQYTPKGDGLKYGCESKEVDLNWWYGDLTSLYAFCGMIAPTPKTLEERVSLLETKVAKLEGAK